MNRNREILKEGPSWTEAYPILSNIINKKGLRVGAEIGVAYAGHTEYILEHTNVENIYAIDPYRHIWGYKDPMNFGFYKFNILFKSAKKRLSKFGNRATFIRKKSKDAVGDILESLDFVYIDADHSYTGVSEDISLWFNKVEDGGIIAGHDYGHPNFPGVEKAVHEFFDRFNWQINFDKSGVWWVEKKPLNISFVIPAFNCEKTICESIESILQTNFNDGDEIVIVDDKSTDGTLNLLKNEYSKNKSIKVIVHEKNMGGGAARNTAVKNTKNDLIFCLDSDNILEKNSIEKLKDFLIRSKSDVGVFKELKYFKEDTKKISHKWSFKSGLTTLRDVFCSYMVPPSSGNYMYTKRSWDLAGGYPEFAKALDARGFGVRQLATGSKMTVMQKLYYFHRFGHESYWTRESKNDQLSLLSRDILKPYYKLLDQKLLSFIETNKDNWFGKIGKIPNFKCSKMHMKICPSLKLRIYKLIPPFIKKPLKKIYFYILFIIDLKKFKDELKSSDRFKINWKDRQPELKDRTTTTSFDPHYIYHPAWAARIIKQINPELHIDISSTLYFSSMLSAFVPVHFYDFRPANLTLSNLKTGKADLLSLPFSDNSIKSISCMHTVEHIGLGRYGDQIDPIGDLKAIRELKRVLAPGGSLLFVVPIGKPKIMFNAHRIYSYSQIISYFNDLKIEEFSLLPDNAFEVGIIKDATKEMADSQNYGCGCFWFKK